MINNFNKKATEKVFFVVKTQYIRQRREKGKKRVG
jgi:hypothetical protein